MNAEVRVRELEAELEKARASLAAHAEAVDISHEMVRQGIQREQALGRIRTSILRLEYRPESARDLGKVWISGLQELGIPVTGFSVQMPSSREGYFKSTGSPLPADIEDAADLPLGGYSWVNESWASGKPVLVDRQQLERVMPSSSAQVILEIPLTGGGSVAVNSDVAGAFDGEAKATVVGFAALLDEALQRLRDFAAVQAYARELELRNAIAEVFLSVADEELYNRVLEVLLEAFSSPYGVFGYIDADGSLVVPTMASNAGDQGQVATPDVVFPRERWGDGGWPRAILDKQVLHANLPSPANPFDHVPIQRHISTPVVYRGEVIGLFQVANKATDYDETDLRMAQTLASTIAPILHGRLLREREERRRREAELAVRMKADELARSNRELEQFAYVASHDLQEPLRMVSSYTQLLAQRYTSKLDQDANDFIHYAVDGANRMQRLIQDLLTYSRVTTRGQPPARVDAHEVLGLAMSNLQAAIQDTGALVTNDDLPFLKGDRSQLVQLLQNLIGNAIKFHRPELPPRVHLSAEPDPTHPGHCTFRITDNGIGIDPRHFDRLFVIFQRLHSREAYPGTGIGLALCKRIVERHGGRIWLDSSPAQGTTVHFTLPTAEPEEGGLQ